MGRRHAAALPRGRQTGLGRRCRLRHRGPPAEVARLLQAAAPQSELENCVAHNGSIILCRGANIMVQGWYQGGLSVFDFTDRPSPWRSRTSIAGPSRLAARDGRILVRVSGTTLHLRLRDLARHRRVPADAERVPVQGRTGCGGAGAHRRINVQHQAPIAFPAAAWWRVPTWISWGAAAGLPPHARRRGRALAERLDRLRSGGSRRAALLMQAEREAAQLDAAPRRRRAPTAGACGRLQTPSGAAALAVDALSGPRGIEACSVIASVTSGAERHEQDRSETENRNRTRRPAARRWPRPRSGRTRGWESRRRAES